MLPDNINNTFRMICQDALEYIETLNAVITNPITNNAN